jgi:nucleoside-diphosphate-sugar epimerase
MILIAGGGGFIGGHLAAALLRRGERVRVVDLKPIGEWWQVHPSADNRTLDLRHPDACAAAVADASQVFNLACQRRSEAGRSEAREQPAC